MKALLDKDGLDRRPHTVAPDCWYYEFKAGLKIYYQSELVGILPWRSIVASVRRAIRAKIIKAIKAG